jgi:acetoacetyl-CoA reductase/3-oxoacyl-[acyl-carrier protein] reductase
MSDPAGLLSLRGRRALVTGGSGGIGAATVARLREAGADVTSVDRPGIAAPPGARALPCDLADPAALEALCAQLAGERHELFVHCAGIARDGMLWKLPPAAWSEVLRVNLESAFWLLRAVLPGMRAAGSGAVVLLSSINGERGKAGQANYAASKAGLLGLAKSAARELGRFGIRVNAIAPGLIRTRMTEHLPDEIAAAALAETALGRLGEPDDVARAVLFLGSDLARHVTGQVLRVDGGQCTA